MVAFCGVYRPSQLRHFEPKSLLGRRRLIAADLLDYIEREDNARWRDAFFERFVDHRGAFKRTYRHRFEAFDRAVAEEMKVVIAERLPLTVLDVSVSDGSTTLDLLVALERLEVEALNVTATDLDTHFFVLRDRRPHIAWMRQRVLASEDGVPVQIVFPPFVFGHPSHENLKWFPVNRAARKAAREYARSIVSRWRAGDPEIEATRMTVANPEFSRRLERDPRIAFRRWNILEPWQGPACALVRAMNVLNPAYFSVDEQRRVIDNLRDAVREGGLLAVGSNDGPSTTVDGALYKKRSGALVEIWRTGEGNRCAGAMSE